MKDYYNTTQDSNGLTKSPYKHDYEHQQQHEQEKQEQAGAELCQAQVKLEIIVGV